MAIDAIVVAFRIGLHVADMARRLDPSGLLGDKSWSIIVPGLAYAEAVGRAHDTTVRLTLSCSYTPL